MMWDRGIFRVEDLWKILLQDGRIDPSRPNDRSVCALPG